MNFKVLIESLCPLRTITGLSSCSSIFILEDLAVGAVCLVESPLFPLFRAKRFESVHWLLGEQSHQNRAYYEAWFIWWLSIE
jgi:hypothetical protein